MQLAVLVLLCAPLLLPLGVLLTLTYYTLLPDNRRAVRLTRNYPKPLLLPFLGNIGVLIQYKDTLFSLPRDLFQTLGSRWLIRIFGYTSVNISDPQAVEALLTSSVNIEKGQVYDFLLPWLGQGLLTSTGALWHSRRKLLTPAFHFRILGQFSRHLEEQAETLVQQLDEFNAAAGPGEPFNVVPFISRATLKSIRVTAMGDCDFETDDDSYLKAVHKVGSAIVYRIIRPWLWPPFGFLLLSNQGRTFRGDLRMLHSFTEKVIAERKSRLYSNEQENTEETENTNKTELRKRLVQPFLDVLLSVQRSTASLTDRDIRNEVDTFMFEGHDTTSMALSWALEMLGRHPAEQEVLAEEVRDAASDWETVSRLPYLDRVFKECLRLRPSVPFISRFITSDIDLRDGQVIPKGCSVNVHIYDLHRHPDHFPDPERFDPDRFLPELEQKRHPFAYVPFSAGPRNCIGKRFAQMEVKLFLAAIVRNFVIRSAMPEKPDIMADLVLRPKTGISLKMTPRL